MATKKATSKKTATKKTDNLVEARPVGQGKDPLASGNTLVNPTNSEAETHYEVKERSDDVREAANKIDGQDANERADQHNAEAPTVSTPNEDVSDQDEVAEGRTEEPAPEVETPAEATTETPAEETGEQEAPPEEPVPNA